MKSELIQKSLIALALRIGSAVSAYSGFVLLGRWMSAEDYGVFGAIISLMAFLGAILGQGMPQSILRFVGEFQSTGDIGKIRGTLVKAAWRIAPPTIILALLGFIICTTLLMLPSLQDTSKQKAWIAVGLVFLPAYVSIELHSALLRGFDKIFNALAPRELIWRLALIPICYLVCQIFPQGSQIGPFLFISCFALWALAAIQAIQAWRLLRNSHETTHHLEMVKNSKSNWLTDISAFGLNNVDVAIVAIFFSLETSGYYFAASRSASLISFALNAVNTVIGPKMAAAHFSGNKSLLSRTVKTGTILSFLPAALLYPPMTLFGGHILGIFGPEFLQAWSLLAILATGQLINALSGNCGLVLRMTGHHEVCARVSLIWFGTALATMTPFAVIGSIHGIALAVAVAISGNELTLWWLTRKRMGINTMIFSIWR